MSFYKNTNSGINAKRELYKKRICEIFEISPYSKTYDNTIIDDDWNVTIPVLYVWPGVSVFAYEQNNVTRQVTVFNPGPNIRNHILTSPDYLYHESYKNLK